jgi:uncharacterized protein (UPF0332 family)
LTEAERALLDKASESLTVARSLHPSGHYDFAAARSYYTMFYVASVLLLRRGLRFKKHSGVISAFGKELVKSGEISAELHGYLIDAQDSRLIGDYEATEHIDESKSAEHLRQAEEFLRLGESLLGSEKPEAGEES